MGDAAGIYTEAEVEAFILDYLADKHGAMFRPLKAAADPLRLPLRRSHRRGRTR